MTMIIAPLVLLLVAICNCAVVKENECEWERHDGMSCTLAGWNADRVKPAKRKCSNPDGIANSNGKRKMQGWEGCDALSCESGRKGSSRCFQASADCKGAMTETTGKNPQFVLIKKNCKGDTKKTCEFEKLKNTQISRTSGFLDASMLKPAKADCLIKSVANEKWWENGETRPGYCVAFTCRTQRGKNGKLVSNNCRTFTTEDEVAEKLPETDAKGITTTHTTFKYTCK